MFKQPCPEYSYRMIWKSSLGPPNRMLKKHWALNCFLAMKPLVSCPNSWSFVFSNIMAYKSFACKLNLIQNCILQVPEMIWHGFERKRYVWSSILKPSNSFKRCNYRMHLLTVKLISPVNLMEMKGKQNYTGIWISLIELVNPLCIRYGQKEVVR